MNTYRVSHLSAFHRWLSEEDDNEDPLWLRNLIFGSSESEAMRKGTAFHAALERACEGTVDSVSQDGYTFHFTGDFELYLPSVREIRMAKEYDGIMVSGQSDAVIGNTIYDHKTTEKSLDAERYLDGYQWRYYLDIFKAERFIWNVWEMKAMDEEKNYCVHTLHRLEMFSYPSLEQDCMILARDFKAWAEK